MSEDLHLLSDLALILISAGVMTIIFKLLKQPLVLGYIVAGFLVGPHFDLFPSVVGESAVSEWSEIGIIFLLFSLGLEFSFKKLFRVGGTAIIASIAEILIMFFIGFVSGYLLQWTTMESIFLGGMLAMSSTTIIIKAFDDLSLRKEKFADITMVILIIQDIMAILMMVLLSTAAVSQSVNGMDLVLCILKLAFFIILWFVVGISVIPTFFRKAKKYINDETLLIISIGLCFGMVVFANAVGFSSALGAFVMGSILSETIEGEHIEKLLKSVKDLFGAIFFVSVGMMVDPHILVEYWDTILELTFIVLVVKGLISAFSVLIAGEDLKTSLQAGFSLAQIGEFAFIIAALGVSLKVMNPVIYPIIVAVAVITTFTTPYCIRLANPVFRFLDKHLPDKAKKFLDSYSLMGSGNKFERGWKKVITTSLARTIIFGVCCFAAMTLSLKFFYPFTINKLTGTLSVPLIHLIDCVITLAVMSPFLLGLIRHSSRTQAIYSDLWQENRSNRIAIVTWTLLRIFAACVFVVFVLSASFKFTKWVLVIIAIALVLFLAFSRNVLTRYMRLEENFVHNLNAKEAVEKREEYAED
ncbi:MAG: cation:proton antiporter [Bacteroidales bacterium]|nr:cation:proton antiporter [Bacteroidales bacterium]